MKEIAPTQRAYTLRLSRGPGTCSACGQDNCECWRKALWETHEAVNKGAKVFGDWLLTLRGGLDHKLATEKLGKKAPGPQNIRDRRVLLALSWFSVEDEHGAPEQFVVVTSKDLADPNEKEAAQRKLLQRFEETLLGRGLSPDEAKAWATDCRDSLCAAIRDKAVWVDRSAAFDEAQKRIGDSLTREEVWDLLDRFFGSRANYFAGIERPANENEEEESEATTSKEEASKDLIKAAGKWLGNRFGSGEGADFNRLVEIYKRIAEWAKTESSTTDGSSTLIELAKSLGLVVTGHDHESLLAEITKASSYTGHTPNPVHEALSLLKEGENPRKFFDDLAKKAETRAKSCASKIGLKGTRPWSDQIRLHVEAATGMPYRTIKDLSFQYAVILDHAARRVSAGHSWIKRAESERLRFEKDRARLGEVSDDARAFLDRYCEERTGSSGAGDRYRIRRRAIDGWKDIVRAWTACADEEKRIAKARELQPELEKFGDIQLFESLAADAACCIWQRGGKPDSEILRNYVLAHDAEDRMRRFKVPAYRHPDPLRHPVFCDFGKSRWDIDFAAHRGTGKELEKAKQEVRNCESKLEKARAKKVRAKDDAATAKAQAEIGKLEKQLGEKQSQLQWLEEPRALRLGLWTGQAVEDADLRWQSKRFAADLCIDAGSDPREGAVSRADRAGRAAGVAGDGAVPEILGVFAENDWNGRLQAPRKQLDSVARLLENGKESKAHEAIGHLNWLVSFSARLQPQGPWVDYARTTGLELDKKGQEVRSLPRTSRDEWRGLTFPFWHPDGEGRKGYGRLLLARLPALRLLSVDLGHRYGAGCTVWETVSGKAVADACRAAGVEPPPADRMHLTIPRSADGKRRRQFYRRIGPDTLADDRPHPAPWARLDRRFTIRLQGEDGAPRKPFEGECEEVAAFESWLGCTQPPEKKLPTVLDLMVHAVALARLGVARHGRRARIAWGLTTPERLLTGGRSEKFRDAADHEKFLTDLLADWHGLAQPGLWHDAQARELWEQHIVPLGAAVPDEEESATARERRKAREALREKLAPVAAALRKNESLRKKLSVAWEQRWTRDDGEWKKRLKWLGRWLLPRGVAVFDEEHKRRRLDRDRLKAIRNVGGLSLDRLAAIRSLYQVQKQYRMKSEPDHPRKNVPARHDHSLEKFGRRTLDALEAMREQRVKQLASRLLEAALGIGSEDARHREGGRRPRQRIDDPRFAPCHAVVIEDLTRYRPDETRTRRENRQLMTWSSSKVKKYLQEGCELHGLHLREVRADYTSRQDPHTGAPGMRCTDVPLPEFLREGGFWQGRVGRAIKKRDKDKKPLSPAEELLIDLADYWLSKKPEERPKDRSVRVIQRGGEVFVPADANSPIANGMQSDLVAAGNVGLKALLDPDWPGAWWRVPCVAATLIPASDKIKGAEAAFADAGKALLDERSEAKKKDKKEIYNLWRDPGTEPLAPGSGNHVWKFHGKYWEGVERRVTENLREFNKLAPPAERQPSGEDIPY